MKFSAIAALAAALALGGCSKPKAEDEANTAQTYVAAGKLAEKPFDHTLGERDAPVQIVEYASLDCHHCRDFAVGSNEHPAVFPLLKQKYIDTGKVRFIFREFPLSAYATAATLAANCIAGTTTADPPSEEQNTRYFAAVHLVYDRLDYWYLNAGTGDVAMQRLPEILRAAGMSESAFQTCMENETLLTRVRDMHSEGTLALGITSTPTFFINGEKHSGVIDFDKLEAILAKQLPGGAPAPTAQ